MSEDSTFTILGQNMKLKEEKSWSLRMWKSFRDPVSLKQAQQSAWCYSGRSSVPKMIFDEPGQQNVQSTSCLELTGSWSFRDVSQAVHARDEPFSCAIRDASQGRWARGLLFDIFWGPPVL